MIKNRLSCANILSTMMIIAAFIAIFAMFGCSLSSDSQADVVQEENKINLLYRNGFLLVFELEDGTVCVRARSGGGLDCDWDHRYNTER